MSETGLEALLPAPATLYVYVWWTHHSSFAKGDLTMKFRVRLGYPQQGRQIRGGVPKICDFQSVF